MRVFSSLLLALATAASSVSAATYSTCPVDGAYCVQFGAPASTISNNAGNLYIQMQASTAYSWVALGQGSRMVGSNIFIMYADGSGNVTVSTRSGSGHTEPTVQSTTKITLLAGSGVANGLMTANFVCENCNSWSAGSMKLGAASTSWISSWKKGAALNSANTAQSITVHDDTDSMTVDLATASISEDANPFLTSKSTLASSSSGSSSSSSSTSTTTNPSFSSNSSSSNDRPNLIRIHGSVMGAMFVILYPLGTVLMPALHKWAVHGFIQIIAMIGMWIGFGLGHSAASKAGILYKDAHQIIGTFVCVAMMLQPFLGFWHHRYFLRTQTRGMVSYVHIWWGRMLLGLGVVNGGLGLSLAGANKNAIAVYSLLAGLWAVIYAIMSSLNELNRDRQMISASREKAVPIGPLRNYQPADYERNYVQPEPHV